MTHGTLHRSAFAAPIALLLAAFDRRRRKTMGDEMKPIKRLRRCILAGVVALVGLGWGMPRIARADDASREAKAFYADGMKQYNLGRYREAVQSFEKGYFAKPDPAFLFNLGQCYRMLREPEEAAREYRAYLRAQPNAANRRDVEAFIEDAEAEIRRRANPAPPVGTIAPEQPIVAEGRLAAVAVRRPAEVPAEAATPPPAAMAPRNSRSRLWATIGVVAGVVVAAGASVGITYALPKDAIVPEGHAAIIPIQF